MRLLIVSAAFAFLAACAADHSSGADSGEPLPTGPDSGSDAGVDAGVPVRGPQLGTGDHTAASVTLVEIASGTAGLKAPRDLAFNPMRPFELWVVNHADDSVLIVHDAPAPNRTYERRKDGYALHFMAEPSALAFGADATTIGKPGTFATCGESRNTYDGMAPANDFMGITLWSSDLSVFAQLNPNGLGSHLDMLHNSPLCMGLAHQSGNIYWAFAGLSKSIVKYDFKIDDGIGNDNHSDGEAYQYVTGQVGYQPGVPSHLAYDAATRMLYIADTANHRVARLDTATGMRGTPLTPKEPMAAYFRWEGAVLSEVVAESTGLVSLPSGIELHDGLLFVSDNANGRISAFTLAGERVNYLDTGFAAGSLAGMAFGPDGRLYLVDMTGNRVLRVDPK